MTNFLERINQWNERMNGLPRKGILIAVTLLLTWVFILIVPLCWPFLLALLFSAMLLPLIRLCNKHLKRLHIPRWVIALIGMALLFGVLGVGVTYVVRRLIHELIALIQATPTFVNWISNTAVPYIRDLYQQYSDILPSSAMDVINKSLSSLGDNVINTAGTLSATLTSSAVNAAASIPGMLLSVVLTIMGTFYFTVDHDRIVAFFQRTFPKDMRRHGMLVKNNLFRSLFGQIKSQLTVSLIITTFLVLAFVIYGVKYGMLMGFVIGLADALPVIGAGLFLIPWATASLILGNYGMGIFLMFAYLGTVLIRQISEPRIVGANLGLYPLATMIAMFAGFQLIGVLGLIIGPILLNLIKVVLEADDISRGVKKQSSTPRGVKKVLQQIKTDMKPEEPTPGPDGYGKTEPGDRETKKPDIEA